MTFRAADVFGDYPVGKQSLEVTCVRGVLARLGFDLRSVRAQDRPDVVADLTNGKASLALVCESGLVYGDATASGSPLRGFWNMWLGIAREVRERLGAQQTQVPYCAVHFCGGSNIADLRNHRGIVGSWCWWDDAGSELDGLVAREIAGGKVILPLWHKVSKDEVIALSPSLADKLALSTAAYSISEPADELMKVLRPDV